MSLSNSHGLLEVSNDIIRLVKKYGLEPSEVMKLVFLSLSLINEELMSAC